MPRKCYSTEQIVTKLRQAEVEFGRGLRTPPVCKTLGISEQTYYAGGRLVDRRDHRRRQLDLGDAVEMEASLVNGAVVHVAQRHPSAGQHPVQLDDPADQIRVGLLPERFVALAEALIQEGRDRVGERVRIEPGGIERVPRQPAIRDSARCSRRLGPTRSASGGCRGKNRLSLQGPARRRAARDCPPASSRAGARTGAYTPTSCRTRPRRQSPRRYRGHAPGSSAIRGPALDGSDRVMDLADDDRRRVGRRRKRPRRKAGPEPHTDAHPGEPDPGCGEKELAGQAHGHAGRDVVPRDDGAVHGRGVVADEHRHGIGLGKRAGPTSRRTRHWRRRRPGTRGCVGQTSRRSSRLVVRPACGPGSLPARIHTDGSDLPEGEGGV